LPQGCGMKKTAKKPHTEKFCIRCGARLSFQKKDGKPRPVCSSCGWIYFKNPASASAAVILIEGKLVLIKRKVAPHVGSWCLPAGFEEYDESPRETAVREVKEETNLDVRIVKLHDVYFSTAYPDKNTVVHIYLAEPTGGTLCPGDDAIEARAFPLDELPSDIAFQSHLDVIQKIRNCKGTSEFHEGDKQR
jgi:8-oxo-dGTP diphosphatase